MFFYETAAKGELELDPPKKHSTKNSKKNIKKFMDLAIDLDCIFEPPGPYSLDSVLLLCREKGLKRGGQLFERSFRPGEGSPLFGP